MGRVKADELYICFESFVAAGESETPSYSRGMRLSGDHPAVRTYPQYFLPADTPDDVVMRVRHKMWADAGAVLDAR